MGLAGKEVQRAFNQRFRENLRRVEETHRRRKKRYTGGRDPLDNYRETAEWLARVLEIEHPTAAEFVRRRRAVVAMVTRMAEKFQRIITMIGQKDFFEPGQGEDESFQDTLTDIAVIANLIEIETWRIRCGERRDRS